MARDRTRRADVPWDTGPGTVAYVRAVEGLASMLTC
jgi:hypothetical protein